MFTKCKQLYIRMEQIVDKLSHIGLQPLDCGRSGSCMFKSIGHQLFGKPEVNQQIRTAEIEHIKSHTQKFTLKVWLTIPGIIISMKCLFQTSQSSHKMLSCTLLIELNFLHTIAQHSLSVRKY